MTENTNENKTLKFQVFLSHFKNLIIYRGSPKRQKTNQNTVTLLLHAVHRSTRESQLSPLEIRDPIKNAYAQTNCRVRRVEKEIEKKKNKERKDLKREREREREKRKAKSPHGNVQ